MVALRDRPTPPTRFRALAPQGQYLGEPRFKWLPLPEAWLYRVELTDAYGHTVARGWSGMHELPLAWLRDPSGRTPELMVGEKYRWQVFAYQGPPDGEPWAAAPETEFQFLGP